MNFSLLGTKSFFPKAIALFGLLFIAVTGPARAYDTPDFNYDLFSPDGLFLEESEQADLMEALLAVAANDSTDQSVDSDLKEKALAIALRISPLHDAARSVHNLLLKGKVPPAPPAPPSKFKTKNSIAQFLWETAEKLTSPPP